MMRKPILVWLWAGLLAVGVAPRLLAQCPGQVAVSIQITTDGYGSETYWQLVPGGNACGVGTIASGGNPAVGCNGGGLQNDPAGGYGNNFTTTVGPYCQNAGTQLTIRFVDDWGDGGIDFVILMDGIPTYTYNTIGQNIANGSYTFTVQAPVANEIALSSPRAGEYSRIPTSQVANRPLTCTVANLGTNNQAGLTVTANVFEMGNPTPVFTATSNAVNVNGGATTNVTVGTWPLAGSPNNYTVEFTLNGGTDTDPANNTATTALSVTPNNYARDRNNALGGLGTNAGNIRQGQVFTVVQDEQLISIEAYINGGLVGDSVRAEVYPITGTTPGALIASTPITQLTVSGPGWTTFAFTAPPMLVAGDYLMVLNHLDASPVNPNHNIGLGYDNQILTANKALLSIANGAWATTASQGFNVTYLLRANLGTPPPFDLAFVAPDYPAVEYTRYPLSQLAGPLNAGGYVSNIGGAAQSNVVLNVSVYQDGNFGTPVYQASSAPTAIPANDTVLISAGTFTPTAVGRYTFRYNVVLAGEVDNTNNQGETDFWATQFEFARDNGVRVGSVGVGSGPGELPRMGQNFSFNVNTRLDSVSFLLATPHVGDTIKVRVFSTTPDFSGPNVLFVPDAQLATTATYTITAATANNWVTLPLTTPLSVMGGDVVTVLMYEGDSIMSIGTTAEIFTPGAGWVNWATSPANGWANTEEFGSVFARPLMLRVLSQNCPVYTANADVDNITCNGSANGAIDVTITNGTGLTYAWSNGASTPAITGLAPGTYTLTVTDPDGCQAQFTYAIQQPAVLSASATGTNPTTVGGSDGSVTANGTGGTVPYTFSLNGGTPQTGNVFSGLTAGNYTVTVTDANGCTSTSNVSLSDPVGAQEMAGLLGWDAFPNPTSGMVTVRLHFAEPTPATLEVLDLTGRTLRQTTLPAQAATEARLDLGTLPAGSYLLRLKANGRVATQSLVRQ
jgi:hypothetical protein